MGPTPLIPWTSLSSRSGLSPAQGPGLDHSRPMHVSKQRAITPHRSRPRRGAQHLLPLVLPSRGAQQLLHRVNPPGFLRVEGLPRPSRVCQLRTRHFNQIACNFSSPSPPQIRLPVDFLTLPWWLIRLLPGLPHDYAQSGYLKLPRCRFR